MLNTSCENLKTTDCTVKFAVPNRCTTIFCVVLRTSVVVESYYYHLSVWEIGEEDTWRARLMFAHHNMFKVTSSIPWLQLSLSRKKVNGFLCSLFIAITTSFFIVCFICANSCRSYSTFLLSSIVWKEPWLENAILHEKHRPLNHFIYVRNINSFHHHQSNGVYRNVAPRNWVEIDNDLLVFH